jgi:AcrR family transcriptional regulator
VSGTAPSRPYRGIPADERVAARRARLLAACLEEVDAVGVADATVRSIATRAGLTRRYFYESFGDLDALLAAAFDALRDEVTAAVATALEPLHRSGASFEARAGTSIAAALAVVLDEPAKARLLLASGGEHGPLAPRRAASLDAFVALVAAELPDRDRDDAALRARMIAGGLIETVDAWLRGALPPSVDRERLLAQATAMAAALAPSA